MENEQENNALGARIDFGLQRDYNQGALLNALDDLCCVFQAFREISDAEMAEALEMYARKKRRDAEQ